MLAPARSSRPDASKYIGVSSIEAQTQNAEMENKGCKVAVYHVGLLGHCSDRTV